MPSTNLVLNILKRNGQYRRGMGWQGEWGTPIGVLEHAVLQTDNDELAALEPRLDQPANVLSV